MQIYFKFTQIINKPITGGLRSNRLEVYLKNNGNDYLPKLLLSSSIEGGQTEEILIEVTEPGISESEIMTDGLLFQFATQFDVLNQIVKLSINKQWYTSIEGLNLTTYNYATQGDIDPYAFSTLGGTAIPFVMEGLNYRFSTPYTNLSDTWALNDGQSNPRSDNKNIMELLATVEPWIPSPFPTRIAKYTYHRNTGDKRYELSNHLGNVLSVVSDKKIPKLAGSSLQYFNPDVKAYNDYYPFGMLLPGRHANTSDYRYGFNGKEMDDEVKGEGNSINFSMRMYDPRLNRFMSHDPLFKFFPWNSPYAISENRLIDGLDLEGGEFEWFMIRANAGLYGETVQKVTRGVTKSIDKTADGIIFLATNPGEAAQATGNFVLTNYLLALLPPGDQEVVFPYLDGNFGTSTQATREAFVSGVRESVDKLLHGDLEDRSEIVTDLVTGILAAKGTDKVLRIGQLSLTTKASGKVIIQNLNKVVNDIRADRVLVGKSDKVAVIGRGQENRVNVFAKGLEAETGIKVETWGGFDPKLLPAENVANNKKWVQKLKDEGYTVYDVGTGPKSPNKGAHYGMETKELFGDN